MYGADPRRFPFADLVASCDVVLSKPGFGILSECAVNDRPLAYAQRNDFPEMEILEPAARRFLRCAPVSLDALYADALRPALEAARAAPAPPDRIRAGGDLLAARHIAERAAG